MFKLKFHNCLDNNSFLSTALLLAIANGIGRKDAFCTSELLTEAYKTPTLFCKAQGVLMHYASNAVILWFVVYSINLVQVS